MRLLNKLEGKIERYIPQHITNGLLIAQVISYLIVYTNPQYAYYFFLNGSLVMQGQWWRLITFLFAPVSSSVLFAILAFYFFYLLGNALESRWGSARYLIYIAISYLGSLIGALLFPNQIVNNIYLYTSLFLAFAQLYPNFRVLLFFIIPVQVKWLGYLAWIGLLLSFISGSFIEKIFLLLAISNFFIFFYTDLMYMFSALKKKSPATVPAKFHKAKPHHICAVCGQNEIDNPDMEIRYCSICQPETCYCGVHIKNHQHKRYLN